jgi:hypothetical protein
MLWFFVCVTVSDACLTRTECAGVATPQVDIATAAPAVGVSWLTHIAGRKQEVSEIPVTGRIVYLGVIHWWTVERGNSQHSIVLPMFQN